MRASAARPQLTPRVVDTHQSGRPSPSRSAGHAGAPMAFAAVQVDRIDVLLSRTQVTPLSVVAHSAPSTIASELFVEVLMPALANAVDQRVGVKPLAAVAHMMPSESRPHASVRPS